MTSKGVYPYEYIDTYNKLHETQLPEQNKFYSSLNNASCDDEDYKRAVTVWNTFNCNSILDYNNLYLQADVLLLADIWDNFKNVCYNIYTN